MALTSGSKLGAYEIESLLGSGGMGEVYRARDTRLDRTVAIKVLPANHSENPEARERFEREARAISALMNRRSWAKATNLSGKRFQSHLESLVVDLRGSFSRLPLACALLV